MKIYDLISGLSGGSFDEQLKMLYGSSEKAVLRNRARYLSAAENFSRLYPECEDIRVFSASGRTEVGGNHTDHQHGCVLAAAVSLDIIGIVRFHEDGVIRIKSEGYAADEIALSSYEVNDAEKGTSAALVRGIAAKFAEMGVKISGFDAYFTSEVLSGSGLSSSAAFEVMIGTIINEGYNEGRASAVEIAKIGKFAENVYFGKASGLMDQMVCAVGGFVAIDFADPEEPFITSVDFDFEKAGYSVCITDTKGSHADLTADYSAISEEMKHVAQALGCEYLRDADEEEFYDKLPELRKKCTDRELLRAAHFFAENTRAVDEAKALIDRDTEWFFELVDQSGTSSAELLQNLYSCQDPQAQQIPLTIMLSKRFLNGSGAVRVHGGGFAGTIQAFVPNYLADDYAKEMERFFGAGSCYVLSVRPVGGCELSL
ncbi:galactokinase [Ruminococcus flavefaciens]|uniref:Galactokinase n=1 Tax=Ruminococcus flavefaciens TaxID=1265 RepID=A0A1M7IJA0_RUMFL|nr:galactokinase family protein [Ruminococcus flavefaciens]SHM40678.1 galactokinase [Ruminococcus flavefaciens]